MIYEAPKVVEVGTVAGLTRGLNTLTEWNDEYHMWGYTITLPGTGNGHS
jgi:hypothetical protein